MTNNKEWSPQLQIREDDALTLSGFGSKRNRGSTGTTKVDTHPDMNLSGQDDGKGKTTVGRGFDKNTDPARNRPNSIEFPGQNYSPKNPVSERNLRLTKNYLDAIEAQTKRAQKMQRPGNK
jgi:hypothetical protein